MARGRRPRKVRTQHKEEDLTFPHRYGEIPQLSHLFYADSILAAAAAIIVFFLIIGNNILFVVSMMKV